MRKEYLEVSLFILLMAVLGQSCKINGKEARENQIATKQDTMVAEKVQEEAPPSPTFETVNKDWEELGLPNKIVLDIRYATANNFTKKQIYDCPRCLLRTEAAQAIRLLNEDLIRNYGYKLKMFDCFRPRDYQQRLWDIVPNPSYVTPPSKGSMHNRGLAVDLTIVDSLGIELDMGTEYDFFGEEAHYDYTKLSEVVLKNRKFLRSKMEEYGFEGIRTEWWHFSYQKKQYALSNYRWPCN